MREHMMFWAIVLALFVIAFMLGLVSLLAEEAVLNIMPYRPEDVSIMVLSSAGILKSVWHLGKAI
jgi:hypothetical protein